MNAIVSRWQCGRETGTVRLHREGGDENAFAGAFLHRWFRQVTGRAGIGKSATGTISNDEAEALTARFENVPTSHSGSTAFTFEFHFGAEIDGLSYAADWTAEQLSEPAQRIAGRIDELMNC